MQRVRCPACKEQMLAGTTVCKACGYDLSDRLRARPRSGSIAIVIGASAVLVIGLVLVLVAELAHRPKTPKVNSAMVGSLKKDLLRPDSAKKAEGLESLAAPVSRSESKPAPGQELVRSYIDKIDAVLDKVNRLRKRLNDTKRMTQKSQDILNKAESDLNGVKGMVSTLGTTPTRESQDALKAVIDNRLTEIRKQFAEIQP
jgi:hypothetical protein